MSKFSLVSKMFTVLVLFTAVSAHAVRYCNPSRSHPCGKGCIPLDSRCTKNWSTSISGENPNSGGKQHYSDDQVKHVDVAPNDKAK